MFLYHLDCQFEFYSFRENEQELFNAMGSLYAAVLFIGITNATAVQPVVSVERFVSYRERAAGMYSALSFAFAQVYYLHIISTFICSKLPWCSKWQPLYFLCACRLLLNSLMCLDRQLYTAQFSTPWPHLNGLLWNLFGTYSLCILPCYTSHFMEWWQLPWHQIIMWLPSLLLHFICCGTFSVALWFLAR